MLEGIVGYLWALLFVCIIGIFIYQIIPEDDPTRTQVHPLAQREQPGDIRIIQEILRHR